VIDLFSSIFKGLLSSYLKSRLELAKIRAAACYVNGVKVTRRLLILWCKLVFCLVLLGIGLALIPIALCLYMPWAPQTKAIVAISFGFVYIVVALLVMLDSFSQKRWMKVSGANELVNSVLEKK
jgi:hypothetical protein